MESFQILIDIFALNYTLKFKTKFKNIYIMMMMTNFLLANSNNDKKLNSIT